MIARVVALLLTSFMLISMVTGAATAAAAADNHAAATVIDNAPDSLDLDPVITVRPVAIPAPISQLVSPFAAARQQPPTGRLHAVLVFRPPR